MWINPPDFCFGRGEITEFECRTNRFGKFKLPNRILRVFQYGVNRITTTMLRRIVRAVDWILPNDNLRRCQKAAPASDGQMAGNKNRSRTRKSPLLLYAGPHYYTRTRISNKRFLSDITTKGCSCRTAEMCRNNIPGRFIRSSPVCVTKTNQLRLDTESETRNVLVVLRYNTTCIFFYFFFPPIVNSF